MHISKNVVMGKLETHREVPRPEALLDHMNRLKGALLPNRGLPRVVDAPGSNMTAVWSPALVVGRVDRPGQWVAGAVDFSEL